jgi:hypothetical protein
MPLLTEEELNDFIRTNLLGPKRVQVGEESVEQHSIEDLLKALQHVQGQDAVDAGATGLRFFQLKPPEAG